MHEKNHTPGSVLAELRGRLETGRVRMRLSQTQFAARAGLSRGTVHKAFKAGEPVPTTDTVAALARALGLPVGELLALRRTAAGDGDRSGPGRPVGEWDPYALEVHLAGTILESAGGVERRVLPGYVAREHDRPPCPGHPPRVVAGTRGLRQVQGAEAGRSRMLVLVGESSTGKTRACWEAVQPLADQGWWLWHPYDPTRAEAALEELHRVGSRTVVWLNEAQHYLGDPHAGERIAAAVHTLLVQPERGPVLVLGTLWPDYATQYTTLPAPGAPDPYSRVRELLAGRIVHVPAAFDPAALAKATALAEAGDRLLADALTRARSDGRLTQDLAGAPELLHRYDTASPAARALLDAAMDARRLGVGPHLPQAFLTDAAPDYLTDTDYDQLTDDWAERAYAELAKPVHGKHAPLRRVTPRPQRRPPGPTPTDSPTTPLPGGPVFRLADYLEQHGRTTRPHLCPPASFWHAAHTHLTHPDDLNNLAQAAKARHRLQWAHHLQRRAADHGSTHALEHLAGLREEAGDRAGAEALYREAAARGDTYALDSLARQREEAGDGAGAEALYREAAARGSTYALVALGRRRERAGDRAGAEALAREAAARGDTGALVVVARLREEAGDAAGAEALYREAADHGSRDAPFLLAMMREEAGDREGAERLARQADEYGDGRTLVALAVTRERSGDREGAQHLYQQAVECGHSRALVPWAVMREEAGDREGAEFLARQAANHGCTDTPVFLVQRRLEAGDWESADRMCQLAVDHGEPDALMRLARMREQAGDREGAEFLARHAYDHGDPDARLFLAWMRERAGDAVGAEALFREAAERGSTQALEGLANMREEAGDWPGAEVLYRKAADRGYEASTALKKLWPFGLDPDGTPTPPWQDGAAGG
ncbi:helix-turn-helix domain-containing protein [Streptomyces sp. NPDC047999]|uniref:helix-turn-helix domain-containing protein n=1 Tax=Streptomyces sp. NPDC047999 TaxID=3365497 RepID=UPI003718ABB1